MLNEHESISPIKCRWMFILLTGSGGWVYVNILWDLFQDNTELLTYYIGNNAKWSIYKP